MPDKRAVRDSTDEQTYRSIRQREANPTGMIEGRERRSYVDDSVVVSPVGIILSEWQDERNAMTVSSFSRTNFLPSMGP